MSLCPPCRLFPRVGGCGSLCGPRFDISFRGSNLIPSSWDNHRTIANVSHSQRSVPFFGFVKCWMFVSRCIQERLLAVKHGDRIPTFSWRRPCFSHSWLVASRVAQALLQKGSQAIAHWAGVYEDGSETVIGFGLEHVMVSCSTLCGVCSFFLVQIH